MKQSIQLAALSALAAAFAVAPLFAVGEGDHFALQRAEMVERQILKRGIRQPEVLSALRAVPRHVFVPESIRSHAYEDYPLAIGEDQTISQPYIVALMTQLLQLEGGEKVLEIGTGSGYQAAVLSRIAGQVFSIEIIDALASRASSTLRGHGYQNVKIRTGDGYRGWPEEAPFDAIILTAAAPAEIPPPLIEQLKVGGRLVAPIGRVVQDLVVFTKTPEGLVRESVSAVVFVPMTGEVQDRQVRH